MLSFSDPKRGQERPWAIVNKHKTVLFLSLARDEESMWTWYLGWPAPEEIEAKKQAGFRCVPVSVTV
jgi:hypothetical protein